MNASNLFKVYLNLHQMNALRVVDAQAVGLVGGGGDVARRTARGLQRWHACLGTLAFDHLPSGVVDCDAILAHDERVGVPEMLGVEAGPALIDRGDGIANEIGRASCRERV